MNALEIIDRIEKLIEKSKRVPFTSNVMINENELYEMLDELRSMLPDEFKQARWIVKEREGMIEEAKRQSESIIKEAEEKAEVLVNETEILKEAGKKSEEIMSMAEAKARTMRLESEDYADEKLASLEAVLHRLVSAVEKGREQLKTTLTSKSR